MYFVKVENVDFVFEPIRVDITAKGKIRARKLAVLQVRVQYDNYCSNCPSVFPSAECGQPTALSAQTQLQRTYEVLPQEGGMENYRHAHEPDGAYAGDTAPRNAHHPQVRLIHLLDIARCRRKGDCGGASYDTNKVYLALLPFTVFTARTTSLGGRAKCCVGV